MTISSAVIARTKQFEGEVTNMYLDTLGYVTVGVGHMLASPTAAQAVSFVLLDGVTVATADQIATEYANIKAMAPALSMSQYKAEATMNLASGADDTLLAADLGGSETQLRAAFGGYDSFPEPAQEALLDMMFNMGPNKFTSAKWPSLFKAVNAGDWITAAAQSNRPQVQAARNTEIASLFQQAAG